MAENKKKKRVKLGSTERIYIWEHPEIYGDTCNICYKKIEKISELELDHIKPYSKGGKIQALAHKECNRMKGNKSLKDVQKKMGFNATIEKKRNSLDLQNEFEKFYGPVHSILNSVVFTEEAKAVLAQDEKKILDEIFSKEPFVLESQEAWRNHFHMHRTRDIDTWFVNRFFEEYETTNKKDIIEKQFSSIYSILKNVPQNIEKVAILLPEEKRNIDKLFLAYPLMVSEELYAYWNTKIRTIKPTLENCLRYILILQVNLKNATKDSSEAGLYLIPKAFVLEFIKEYENKVNEYRKVSGKFPTERFNKQ